MAFCLFFFFYLEYVFDIQGFLETVSDLKKKTGKCKFNQLWNLNDFRAQKEDLQKRKQIPTYRSYIRRVMRMKTCDYSMVCIFSWYCTKKRKEYSWEATSRLKNFGFPTCIIVSIMRKIGWIWGGCYNRGLLLFSSPELEGQVSLSDQLLSVCPSVSICLSVCPSVNFSHFQVLLQNHCTIFNQTWHKASYGGGDSSLFKWRAKSFLKGRL